MSYFVFGEVSLRDSASPCEHEELCFSVARAALRVRLGIQLGGNITQGDIYRMLHRARIGSYAKSIPYLLTDSPISNHSSALVRPDSYYQVPGNRRSGLTSAATALARFVSDVRSLGMVEALSVWVTLGFDIEFVERRVRVRDLATEWCDLLCGEDFQSCRLIVEP